MPKLSYNKHYIYIWRKSYLFLSTEWFSISKLPLFIEIISDEVRRTNPCIFCRGIKVKLGIWMYQNSLWKKERTGDCPNVLWTADLCEKTTEMIVFTATRFDEASSF